MLASDRGRHHRTRPAGGTRRPDRRRAERERLRAGRIRYYDAIPDPSDTGLNNRFWTTATLTNENERFWKEYIDVVLGVRGTGAGTYSASDGGIPVTAKIGNGDLFDWTGTTFQITTRPKPSSGSPSRWPGRCG